MSLTPPTTHHEPTHQRETPEGPMANEIQSETRRQVSDPISACGNCRRRKLKCSKELPKCQQCRKTGMPGLLPHPSYFGRTQEVQIDSSLFVHCGLRGNCTPILMPGTAINCEYDMKRNKTGMKPGAIENIHRKIGTYTGLPSSPSVLPFLGVIHSSLGRRVGDESTEPGEPDCCLIREVAKSKE